MKEKRLINRFSEKKKKKKKKKKTPHLGKWAIAHPHNAGSARRFFLKFYTD